MISPETVASGNLVLLHVIWFMVGIAAILCCEMFISIPIRHIGVGGVSIYLVGWFAPEWIPYQIPALAAFQYGLLAGILFVVSVWWKLIMDDKNE